MELSKKTLAIDGEEIVCEYNIKEINAIILHGAGISQRKRFYAIAQEIMKHDIGVVLFDFPGHGESSGELSEQTLDRRRKQVQGIIEDIVPEGKLYLLGVSMGAQTLCDLLPVYENRAKAILLGCPAIYTEEARDIMFGNQVFTSKLREKNSWQKSQAPAMLKNFTGRAVIAIGDQDEVIPSGVIDMLKNAVQNLTYIECPGVTHNLAKWLGENPKELSKLVKQLVL